MTGEQYVRANKRVYNVVIILLAVISFSNSVCYGMSGGV